MFLLCDKKEVMYILDVNLNKSDRLNQIFNNRLLKRLMPITNLLITFIKTGSCVVTKFNSETRRYISKESKRVIHVDEKFYWNISYNRLKENLKEIVCRDYLPKKGDVVVDLGAGVGTEIVVFQDLVGEDGKVYAIEAHPRTAFSLNLMIKLNGFRNVMVSQLAIGKYTGSVMMDDRDNHMQNAIRQNTLSGVEVPITTFDDFVEKNRIDRIDFLKVNIEGAEVDLIEGMNDSIRIVRHLAVSCHDFLDPIPGDRIRKQMIAFLVKHHFHVEESMDVHPVRRSLIYARKI
jgi:FkbM family methyltransferase